MAIFRSDVDNPLRFLRAQAYAFLALGPEIWEKMHQAAELAAAAGIDGREGDRLELRRLVEDLGELYQLHERTTPYVAHYVGEDGSLGGFPLAWVLAGGFTLAGTAIAVSFIQTRYGYLAQIVDAAAAGELTPEMLAELRELADQAGGGIAETLNAGAKVLLIGAAALIAYQVLGRPR